MEITEIEKELDAIKERNARVEADKAWETSWFRIFTITLLIYLAAVVWLYMIDVSNFWSNALVPAVGYFLSVQSLPFIKKWWLERNS